jgi:energy-coupling factor transporter ATP-binding protein EcfA2
MSSLFKELPDVGGTRREAEAKQRERYTIYGLVRNPFPLGGNFPEGYLDYTYLEASQQEEIEDFLFSTFNRGEFNGMLILGEYGSGKSHLLNYINEMINTDKMGTFGGCALAFIIENPSVAPEDILLSLLRKIKLGTLQDLVFLPIRRKLQEEYSDNAIPFLEDFTTFARQMKLGESTLVDRSWRPSWYSDLFLIGYREFCKRLEEENVQLKSKEFRRLASEVLMSEVTDNPIIVESLANLIFGDESKDARSWESFLVSSLVGRRKQVVGVEFYLEAFLRLFEIMGVLHVYLLVDELEDLRTQRLSKPAATEYLATLRRMIQHNYTRFSFVLASTRDAWNDLQLWYPAIQDRFPRVIDLTGGPEQAKSVVAEYLRKARDGEYPQDDIWFPFSEEAINRLIEIRGHILRHVITECRRLIDIGTRDRVAPPLTPEFVEETVPLSKY